MKIIFVGSKASGNFVFEEAQSRGWDLFFVKEDPHIKAQVNEVALAASSGCDFIIYDTRDYIDDAEVIASEIVKLKKATSSKPIILADTTNTKSTLIRVFLEHDIKSFINYGAASSAELKDELLKNVSSYFDANPREDIEFIREQQNAEKKNKEKFKTIGVVGSMRRIGTTTQCIQIVKYLCSIGYKACLVQLNDLSYENRQLGRGEKPYLTYFEKLALLFECETEDKERGFIRYQGTDIYYNQDTLAEILSLDYDFIVYDYGYIFSQSFNKAAFLKDDLQFIVCGSDSAEIDIATELAANVSYLSASFIFSFTADEDRDDVIQLFESYNGAGMRCFFAGYTPNAFVVSNFDLYKKLLPLGEKENLGKAKAFSFLRRKK